MEEKKSIKIIILTFLLILALIVIAFMAYYIYAEKIDNISGITNSNNSTENTNFTDEQIKNALSNYLELRAHLNCNALLDNLTEKGVLNYDDSKKVDSNDGRYITNIKYSDYKNAMLKYVSESEFKRNWNSYYSENSNGNLIAGDGGGGLRVYTIKSIIPTNDSTYSAKVTSVVEDEEYFEEENLTFAVTSNNGNCVIDSLDNESSESLVTELKLGSYQVTEHIEDEVGIVYDEVGVTLASDNLCSVYEGYGSSYIGTYSIENNKMICNTIICRRQEGGIGYSEGNIIFEFEIIGKDEIKLVNIKNNSDNIYNDIALKAGMIYKLSDANIKVLIDN